MTTNKQISQRDRISTLLSFDTQKKVSLRINNTYDHKSLVPKSINPNFTLESIISRPWEKSLIHGNKANKSKPNLDENGITTEELELLHGGRVERYDGVIIVNGLIDDKPVRRLLPLQDSSTEILLRFPDTDQRTTGKIGLSKNPNDEIENLYLKDPEFSDRKTTIGDLNTYESEDSAGFDMMDLRLVREFPQKSKKVESFLSFP